MSKVVIPLRVLKVASVRQIQVPDLYSFRQRQLIAPGSSSLPISQVGTTFFTWVMIAFPMAALASFLAFSTPRLNSMSLASVLSAGVWSQPAFADDLLSLWLPVAHGTWKFPSFSKVPAFSPFFFFFPLFLVELGALKPPLAGWDEALPEPEPLPEPLFAEPEPLPDPLPDLLPDPLFLELPDPLAFAGVTSKAP